MMNMNHLLDKATIRRMVKGRAVHMSAAGISATITVGVGVAAVLLFATKSGKEIRQKMKNKANNN